MQMSYLSLCHVYNRLLVWFFAGFRINARATVESVRLALFRFGRCPLTSSIDERTLRSTTTCLAVLSSRLVATWTPSSSLITSWRTISAGTTPPPRRRSRLHSMRHGLLKIGVLSTCSSHPLDSVSCFRWGPERLWSMEKPSLQIWRNSWMLLAKYLSPQDWGPPWRSQQTSHLCRLSKALSLVRWSVWRRPKDL